MENSVRMAVEEARTQLVSEFLTRKMSILSCQSDGTANVISRDLARNLPCRHDGW